MHSIYRDLIINIVILKGLVVAVVPFFVVVMIRFGRKLYPSKSSVCSY